MNLTPFLKFREFDDSGDPLAGGLLYTYVAGTTTPQATYTDQGGGTPNANPVVLDANGRASVWLDPTLSYKLVLKTSAGVTIYTVDEVVGILEDDSVPTAAIQDLAVTAAKLATGAVTGAAGGGKLAASAINGQTAETAVALTDEFLLYDVSVPALRKITYANIKKIPTIQRLTTGTSQTYTTPSGVLYIKVRMVGGGGGGGGSVGTGSGTPGGNGGNGGDTTFGASLTAGGGSGGGGGTNANAGAGGAGGTATVSAGTTIVSLTGGNGGGGGVMSTDNIDFMGGAGASSPFGGAGGAPRHTTAGIAAVTNSGSGGSGGGAYSVSLASSGGGGGASAYIEVLISAPAATYLYSIGAAGTAGTAGGSGGVVGGAGGSGVIIVEEFY